MLSFTMDTRADIDIANQIARRASAFATQNGGDYPVMEAQMDITATHLNGCPLRLSDLLVADDFNFAHDVFGIRRHLNRETGQLEDCFLPRFAVPQKTDTA